MSNIKKIDGVFVNLDNITAIQISLYYQEKGCLEFCFGSYESVGEISYKTKEQAEARIMEILKKQNSKEIEI